MAHAMASEGFGGIPRSPRGFSAERLIGSRAFWIGLTILGFFVWWPVGLGLLAYSLGSGRMGCGRYWGTGERGARCRSGRGARMSGNRAFDAYRDETLKRLEDEQREFNAFLERLRFAKDKAEFDDFMAARRSPPPAPEAA